MAESSKDCQHQTGKLISRISCPRCASRALTPVCSTSPTPTTTRCLPSCRPSCRGCGGTSSRRFALRTHRRAHYHGDRYRNYRSAVYRWSGTGRGIRTGSRSSVASFWSKPFRCLRQERRQRHFDAQRALQHFHTPRRTLAERAQAGAQSRCTLVSEGPDWARFPR